MKITLLIASAILLSGCNYIPTDCRDVIVSEVVIYPKPKGEKQESRLKIEGEYYTVSTSSPFDRETIICDEKYIAGQNGQLYKIKEEN